MKKFFLNFFVKRIIFDDDLLKRLKEKQKDKLSFYIIRQKNYISFLLFYHHAKKHYDRSEIFAQYYKEDTDLSALMSGSGIVLLFCEPEILNYSSYINHKNSALYVSLILWSRINRFKNKSQRFIYPSGFLKFLLLITRSGRAEVIISQELDKSFLQSNNLVVSIQKKIEEERQSILGRPVSNRKQLIESILNDEHFLSQLSDIRNDGDNIKKAKHYLYEIAANRNYPSIGRFARFLEFIFSKITDGIVVDKEGIERIREISKTKQIVYLPSHRSHADYLLTGVFFYKSKLNIPLFAAGVNMAFFPFGSFFRRLGAYFLRRSFKNNRIYALCFKTYLQFQIHEGNNQLFYIEGGRSRTGKLLPPKLGMLSIIITMLKENRIDDLEFVPISIDYSKLFEDDSYISELAGNEKKDESFLSIIESAKLLKQKQGKIYIQFGKSFSVREYIKNTDLKIETDDSSIFQNSVEKIGKKVIHEINSAITITPSSILSLVLLISPKRNIISTEVMRASRMIHNYLRGKDARTIFDEKAFDIALKHVLKTFINNNLLKSKTSGSEQILTLEAENRLYLDYYKNSIIHLFLPLAFITTIIKSCKEDHITFLELNTELDLLKAIFDFEFIFAESVWNTRGLHDILKLLVITKEIEIKDEIIYFHPRKSTWIDIGYRIIKNYLESYYTCFDYLSNNDNNSNEKETLKAIIKHGKSLQNLESIELQESISKENYKNALLLLKKFPTSKISKILEINSKDALLVMRNKINDYLFF
jgi:glycerol-3-phosphate O-acyltransferase